MVVAFINAKTELDCLFCSWFCSCTRKIISDGYLAEELAKAD